jgi:hypothetical protein
MFTTGDKSCTMVSTNQQRRPIGRGLRKHSEKQERLPYSLGWSGFEAEIGYRSDLGGSQLLHGVSSTVRCIGVGSLSVVWYGGGRDKKKEQGAKVGVILHLWLPTPIESSRGMGRPRLVCSM